MDKNVKLSADERLQKATSGQPAIPEKFTDLKKEKLWLRQEIERQFPSVNQFAQHCYMSHSHLYDPNLPKLLYIGFKLIPQIPYKIGV